jgi:uncharacterized protein (DUF2147 family)
MKKYLCLIILSICFLSAYAATDPDDILGVWSNSKNTGHLSIFKDKGKYYGKLIWLTQPNDKEGKAKVDKNNPDPQVRHKPLLGLLMLKDFKYKNEEWVDGKIYNPDDGKEYKAYIRLKDAKTMLVRGYIGFSWIGKTETFQRIK